MATTAPQEEVRTGEEVIVFLNYRTTFESDNIDTINLESWKEVLDAFGYTRLGRVHFLRELALSTSSEVMSALCPYTTKQEWEPVLNKRAVRLERELQGFCDVEMLPIEGLKKFLISCAKGAAKLTTIFLSPFPETNTRILLDRSEMRPFVDLVHCYTQRDLAMLEALEMLNIKPPRIPTHFRHRWELPGEIPEKHPCRFLSFEADPVGVKIAASFGIPAFGISFNSYDDGRNAALLGPPSPAGKLSPTASAGSNATSPRRKASITAALLEEDENHGALIDADDGGSSLGTKGDAVLLDSGACCVIRDYNSLDYSYLPHMMPKDSVTSSK